MFEDTLLIIKHDFMPKRKQLLQKLLDDGFLIKGRRMVLFTPILAGEFYKNRSKDPCYMSLLVQMTEGPAEALILTKNNAVEDLINKMVCYFGTSSEMSNYLHMTRSTADVQREITFIFPNYIHELLPCFDRQRFCSQPIMAPVFARLYDCVKDRKDFDGDWKLQLAEHLIATNDSIPKVSNQCGTGNRAGFQDQEQQTDPIALSQFPGATQGIISPCPSLSSTSVSSGQLTSSSCISCSGFDVGDTCFVSAQQAIDIDDEGLKPSTIRLSVKRSAQVVRIEGEETEKPQIIDEHIEWVQIYEYEDGAMDSETSSTQRLAAKVEIQSEESVESKTFVVEGGDEAVGSATIVDLDHSSATEKTVVIESPKSEGAREVESQGEEADGLKEAVERLSVLNPDTVNKEEAVIETTTAPTVEDTQAPPEAPIEIPPTEAAAPIEETAASPEEVPAEEVAVTEAVDGAETEVADKPAEETVAPAEEETHE